MPAPGPALALRGVLGSCVSCRLSAPPNGDAVSASAPRRFAALAALALLLAALMLAGCASHASSTASDPRKPAAPDLGTPRSAVASYLSWTAFSYRMANSSLSTPTMSAEEAVRVDAYIELNREQDRAIDEHLVTFDVRSVDVSGTAATLAAYERWEYRYFSLKTVRYLTKTLSASYDSTYTLTRQEDGRWLVDDVAAKALGTVR